MTAAKWKAAYAAGILKHMLTAPCRGEHMCFDCWLYDMQNTWRLRDFAAKCRAAAAAPAGTQWW